MNFFNVSVKLSRSFFRFLLSAWVAVRLFTKSFLLVSSSTRWSASSCNRLSISSCPASPEYSGCWARNSSLLNKSRSVYNVLNRQRPVKLYGSGAHTHSFCSLGFPNGDVVVRTSGSGGLDIDYPRRPWIRRF